MKDNIVLMCIKGFVYCLSFVSGCRVESIAILSPNYYKDLHEFSMQSRPSVHSQNIKITIYHKTNSKQNPLKTKVYSIQVKVKIVAK